MALHNPSVEKGDDGQPTAEDEGTSGGKEGKQCPQGSARGCSYRK